MHSITNYETQEGRFNLITTYNKKKEENQVSRSILRAGASTSGRSIIIISIIFISIPISTIIILRLLVLQDGGGLPVLRTDSIP